MDQISSSTYILKQNKQTISMEDDGKGACARHKNKKGH